MSEQLLKTPCTFGENGNFLLERELGSGGMGGVYMGRDKMLDRPVAVKVMLKEYGADAEFVERFKKEAQAAAKLIHPNIAQIYSYGISDGMPYIAMELVAGGSLWTVMQAAQGKADVTRVLKICQQVAQALQCSTDQGFIHGDIKPENILLDSNGNAKLVDFGLAGMQKDTSEIWGTPYYISPEKVQQAGVDFRSDMYNLGGTLYHALTNVPPFDGEDVSAVVKARFAETPKKPSEIRPDLTPAVDALVMRMLEQDKEKRFPSFEALIEEIKKVLTSGLEAKPEAADPAATGTASATGVKVVRQTTIRNGRRVTTVRRRTTTVAKPADPDIDEQKDEEEEGGGSVGKKVTLAIVGGILAIGAVIGGLIWFKAAAKHSEEAAHEAQIIAKIEQARAAIAGNREQAVKFADEFDAFAGKAVKLCKDSTDELKRLLPDWANELQPPQSKELLDAIASTNEVVAAPAPAAANAATNVAPAAAAKPAAKKVTLADKAKLLGLPPPPEDFDPSDPECIAYMAKFKEAEKAAQAKKAEAKDEAKAEPEKPAEPAKPRPAVLDDMKELWDRTYSCQASAIRIRHRVRKIVKDCDAADAIQGKDEATAQQLAQIAASTTEAIGEIRNGKDKENVSKGITYVKGKGEKAVANTVKRLRIEKLEADRKAAKEAEAEAEKKRAEEAAAAKAKLIEEESARAKDKFDKLVSDGVFVQLDWSSALHQLNKMKEEFKSPEGGFAAANEIRKVEAMKKMQDIFKENLPGYSFKRGKLKGNKVRKVDAEMIDTVKADGKTPQKLSWKKFYKEYRGNLNELINTFVIKGRENGKKHLNLREWADAMSGAALSMRIICGDEPTAAAYADKLVKQVAEAFPDYQKNLKAMFPDMFSEAAAEGDEAKAEEKTE